MFCLPNSSGWVLLVGGLPPSVGDTGTQAPSRLWLWPPPGHPPPPHAAGSGDGAALSRKPSLKAAHSPPTRSLENKPVSMPGSTEGDKWGQMRNAIRAGGLLGEQSQGHQEDGCGVAPRRSGRLEKSGPLPPGDSRLLAALAAPRPPGVRQACRSLQAMPATLWGPRKQLGPRGQ